MNFDLPAPGEPFQGRERCCDEDYGGSHWHCAKCDGVSSMMGHSMGGMNILGKFRKFPDGKHRFSCQPEFAEAVKEFWPACYELSQVQEALKRMAAR